MSADVALLTTVAGLAIGLALGFVLQRTHYCAMGALADMVLFGSRRRLRAWVLAAALAVLGTQFLAAAGVVALGDTVYLASDLPWVAILTGGLAFGFGMVLTGGCVSRSIARAASGSLRSWLVLAVVALSAQATTSGIFAPLAMGLRAIAPLRLDNAGLPEALAVLAAADPAAVRVLAGAVLAIVAMLWVFAEPALRRVGPELISGLALGVLVVAGWAVTGWLATDPSAGTAPVSLAFVGPSADTLVWLVTGYGTLPTFGVAVVIGAFAGAFIAALGGRALRLEGFVDGADVARHLVGAMLMGVGGTLALGCTIGQGISGISTLAFGSMLALAGIVVGGIRGVRYLETGRLLPLPVSGWRRSRPATVPHRSTGGSK